MSSDNHLWERGASIKPSARKSIHNHKGICPFSFGEMRRHVFKNNENDPSTSANRRESVDEVDNILSKPVRSSSPLSIRSNEDLLRRRSLNTSQPRHTDDSREHNPIAKSLPATLPSYSYCRDEYGDWPINHDHHTSNYSNSSLESNKLDHSRQNSRSMSKDKSISSDRGFKFQSAKLSSQTNGRGQDQKKKRTKHILLVPLVATLSVVAAYYSNIFSAVHGSKNTVGYDEHSFHNDMTNLGKKYNVNDNSILQLLSGISTIVKREDTGSFIIVYNSESNNFNPVRFYNFLDDVGFISAKYLRNGSKSVYHLVVDYTDLDMDTHGELISKYHKDVTKSGVMLVKELDKVPSSLAMAFHYYCDEYNPLVKKSAILFTLDMAKCPDSTGNRSVHASIEKCLTNKWNTVPPDNIRPLLTRVVNIVVDVSRDF